MQRPLGQAGQALIMVTVASFALCGLLGLAVDLGWAHFVKKSAQAAADSSALAAAQSALATVGQGNVISCGPGIVCQSLTPCSNPVPSPPVSNIDAGCLYAQQNGFLAGGQSGRQNVTVESNVTSPAPTAPGATVQYWVTTRTVHNVPLLFGSLINPSAAVSARATGAIVDVNIFGSLILTNRDNDCLPMEGVNSSTCGVNLLVSANDNQGQYALRADGGILMASQKRGTDPDGRYAGENSGGGTVFAPATYIRGIGRHSLTGTSQWIQTPQNSTNDDWFGDPFRGKGQPKAPVGLQNRPITGGQIVGSSDPGNPLVLQPGNYYAVDSNGIATGDQIDIRGYVKFGGNASFNEFVIFGGVRMSQPGTNATFSPGMYVLAGVRPANANTPGILFDLGSNATLQDLTAGYGENADAGEIFVFTDPNYRGQGGALQVPAAVAPVAPLLKQGTTGFQVGNNASPTINLHGLNRDQVPGHLKDFAPVVIWQDQANSVVKYDANGEIDTSCGNPDGCTNATLANNKSPEMVLQASPNLHLFGTVYQPRGSWTTIIGGGDYNVPIQLTTGALRVQGNASFSMIQPSRKITRRRVVLVE